MLAALRHPNIVNFLGVCHQPPCILTGASLGYARGGAVHTYGRLGLLYTGAAEEGRSGGEATWEVMHFHGGVGLLCTKGRGKGEGRCAASQVTWLLCTERRSGP